MFLVWGLSGLWRLGDFGWEVSDCVPGMLLSEQDSDVEWMELTQDVLCLPRWLLCRGPYRQLMYLYTRIG